jgi:hypothetical protein
MTMRLMLDERPWYQLTTHFFRGLFDFGFLSDAGSDAFRRVLIGITAVMLSFGLLVTRMYLGKYTTLSEKYHDWGTGYHLNREPYQLAVLGDGALVLAFPMLIVGFVVVLVSSSLFPDEIDCRVLLPLPVSKRMVFACKALAVMVFTSLFAIAAHVAMMPLVVVMWNTRWSDQGLLPQLIAHGLASLGASIVTALVIMAIAGALLICVPRSRLRVASVAFRGAALCGLVLSVPLASRLPTMGALIASESPLFYMVPPAWFLGVQQLLLGHATPYFLRLAQIAAVAAVVSFAVALGSYVFLYQRLERVIFRPVHRSDRFPRQRIPFLRFSGKRESATAAIGPFIRATLTRSPLHQGVFVIIAACGAGLVLNSFVGNWHAGALSRATDSLTATVIWAPFALVFAMNVALRAALVLPIELRANWIFRVTEDEATRAEELSAVVRTLILLGVVLPLSVFFPVEWAVLGPRAIYCTSIAFLCGLVLVELQMAEWRRIPFTCSYAPSRQFVWLTMLIGVAAFVVFTTIGSRLVRYSVGHPLGWLAVMTILGAVLLYLRRQRLWLSQRAPLMFEDVLPNEVEPLRLSEY